MTQQVQQMAPDNPFWGLLEKGKRILQRPWDRQERAERSAAAAAYGKESEGHFVDYCMDCVRQSTKARADIREVQAECYRVYQEKEPGSYANKEPWQSRTVVPKPYQTIQFAAASIRKAFSPEFLTIKDAKNKPSADFWQKVMEAQLNEQRASFVTAFIDATTMALAVGESLEMKPRFIPGRGLQFTLIEPWKIFRDPDAPPRDPQGGMYWVHQEWVDYHVLLAGAKVGKYQNVARAFSVTGEGNNEDPFMSKEAIAARKQQIYERGAFRKLGLVSEFWGQVLSPNGELLLDRATYTVCGGRVIQRPRGVRYRTLNWPGMMYSPQPDLLTLGGRGLLDGIRSVWEAMCNLMCLHEDGLKWIVNPPTEINIDALVNPADVRLFPGKRVAVTDTVSGQQVLRPMQRRDVTNSVLANSQYYDQLYQRGTAVTDAVQGLPGYRQDMTARESEQNLVQANGVFSLMGVNVEMGAVRAVLAAQEVVEAYAGYNDYAGILADSDMQASGLQPGVRGVQGLPRLDGSFHISGVQELMRDSETVATIKGTLLPLSESPRYAPYLKPFNILKALERRTGLEDEGLLVDTETGEAIQLAQQQAMLGPPGGDIPPEESGTEPMPGQAAEEGGVAA